MEVGTIVKDFLSEYKAKTPQRLKVIDVFLAYIMLTGVAQFGYCAVVGTFPFNSFLAGFISAVGCFVLTVCLRMQVNPANQGKFGSITPERAYADFVICNIILHLVVVNFLG